MSHSNNQENRLLENAEVLNQVNDGVSESRASPAQYDAWVEQNIKDRYFPDFDEPYPAWAQHRTTWIKYMVELVRKKREVAKGVVVPFPKKAEGETLPTNKEAA